uniref:Chromosome segregation protein ScpA n=1 Tax=Angiostrongylus cantonensis TaxID=6313 RepID=A0A0K0D668_ANGCA
VKSLLLVKDLALIDKKNNIPVKAVAEFNERQLRIIREDMPLPELLDEFKEGNYHLAMVRQVKQETNSSTGDEDPIELTGYYCKFLNAVRIMRWMVTLEDILEEILQSEILDESDSVVDNVHRRYRRRVIQIQDVYCGEGRSDLLSLNMLEVVSGWLVDRYTIFSNQYFEKQAREKMIQKNIRHNQMSFDVGPWASFGEILLEKLSGSIRVRQGEFHLFSHEILGLLLPLQ